jgi:hypothetical protein
MSQRIISVGVRAPTTTPESSKAVATSAAGNARRSTLPFAVIGNLTVSGALLSGVFGDAWI